MGTKSWGTKRTNCPHCNSIRMSRHGEKMLWCHDCKIPCSKHSTEKSVRNWQIVRAYEDDKLDSMQIAAMYSINAGTVAKVLKCYDVKLRPRRQFTDADREKSRASRQSRSRGRVATREVQVV